MSTSVQRYAELVASTYKQLLHALEMDERKPLPMVDGKPQSRVARLLQPTHPLDSKSEVMLAYYAARSSVPEGDVYLVDDCQEHFNRVVQNVMQGQSSAKANGQFLTSQRRLEELAQLCPAAAGQAPAPDTEAGQSPTDHAPELATEVAGKSPTGHSPDFRSVRWYGESYTFTPLQAACVKVLWENWQNGTAAVGEQTILEAADSSQERLINVFQNGNHPAWKTMIRPGSSKGTFRLVEPD